MKLAARHVHFLKKLALQSVSPTTERAWRALQIAYDHTTDGKCAVALKAAAAAVDADLRVLSGLRAQLPPREPWAVCR